MRRTFAALVEVTVETTDDDEYNHHDLAAALADLDLAALVPHDDVVVTQTTAQSITHKWTVKDLP